VTGARHEYAHQAALYDDTRSASPFTDFDAGALAALCSRPALILESARRARTSFERLDASDPLALSCGLDRLAHDLSRGAVPTRRSRRSAHAGDGTVIACRKP
jgi:hypothetical protein